MCKQPMKSKSLQKLIEAGILVLMIKLETNKTKFAILLFLFIFNASLKKSKTILSALESSRNI